MIALIDYGIGNLRSVQKALEHVGAKVHVTSDPRAVLRAEKVVLCGVGAFGDGMKGLRALGLDATVMQAASAGTPLLGICVGMQVLFEQSEEMGQHEGLGLLAGKVRRFMGGWPPGGAPGVARGGGAVTASPARPALKVPHTGWNEVTATRPSPLTLDLPPGAFAYFNHSYYCDALPEDTLALTDYGVPFASVVQRGRVYGIQFHPEKSQAVGLLLLKNFVVQG